MVVDATSHLISACRDRVQDRFEIVQGRVDSVGLDTVAGKTLDGRERRSRKRCIEEWNDLSSLESPAKLIKMSNIGYPQLPNVRMPMMLMSQPSSSTYSGNLVSCHPSSSSSYYPPPPPPPGMPPIELICKKRQRGARGRGGRGNGRFEWVVS